MNVVDENNENNKTIQYPITLQTPLRDKVKTVAVWLGLVTLVIFIFEFNALSLFISILISIFAIFILLMTFTQKTIVSEDEITQCGLFRNRTLKRSEIAGFRVQGKYDSRLVELVPINTFQRVIPITFRCFQNEAALRLLSDYKNLNNPHFCITQYFNAAPPNSIQISNLRFSRRGFWERQYSFHFFVIFLIGIGFSCSVTDFYKEDDPIPKPEQLVMQGPFAMRLFKDRRNSGVVFIRQETGQKIYVDEHLFNHGIDLDTVVKNAEEKPVAYIWPYLDNKLVPVWRIKVSDIEILSYEKASSWRNYKVSQGWWFLRGGLVSLLLCCLSLIRIEKVRNFGD